MSLSEEKNQGKRCKCEQKIKPKKHSLWATWESQFSFPSAGDAANEAVSLATHTHTQAVFLSFALTLLSLSALVLPHPDQYHRSASYQAAKWPHHHKHTHTLLLTRIHTHSIASCRERVDGHNKHQLACVASSLWAKTAAAALWSVRWLYWFSYGCFICCRTVLNAHFLLSCYTLIRGCSEEDGGWYDGRSWRRMGWIGKQQAKTAGHLS